jgi:hypothetical protein
MSATRYENLKSLRKNIIRITDFLLILFIAVEGYVIYNNVVFDRNGDLYKIFLKGNYQNFDFLDRGDELFIAVARYVDCKNSKINTGKRVDILYERIFFIEVAVYLEVEIGEQTQDGCVEQVLVRQVP